MYRDLWRRKTAALSGNYGRSLCCFAKQNKTKKQKQKSPKVRFEGVQRGFMSERRRKGHSMSRGLKTEKSRDFNSGRSGTRNLEDGGCH